MKIQLSITLEPGTALNDAQEIRERVLIAINKELDWFDNKAVVGSALDVEFG